MSMLWTVWVKLIKNWRLVRRRTPIFLLLLGGCTYIYIYYLSSLLGWTLVDLLFFLYCTFHHFLLSLFPFMAIAVLILFSWFKWKTNSIWYFSNEKNLRRIIQFLTALMTMILMHTAQVCMLLFHATVCSQPKYTSDVRAFNTLNANLIFI